MATGINGLILPDLDQLLPPQNAWSAMCKWVRCRNFRCHGGGLVPAPPEAVAAGPQRAAAKVMHGMPLPAVPAPLSTDGREPVARLAILVVLPHLRARAELGRVAQSAHRGGGPGTPPPTPPPTGERSGAGRRRSGGTGGRAGQTAHRRRAAGAVANTLRREVPRTVHSRPGCSVPVS